MISVGQYKVLEIRGAFLWQSGLAIDADGAYRAYHSKDGPPGLDNLGNAVDLIRDPAGNLVVQGQPVYDLAGNMLFDGADQPAPGFYISPNRLIDISKNQYDARKWGDAESISYLVRPPDLAGHVNMRDIAIVINQVTGQSASALFGDAGNHGHLTEGSIKLAASIGINDDARRGGADSLQAIAVIVFPGSSKGWPRTNEDVALQAIQLLEPWGALGDLVRAVRAGVDG